MKLNPAPLGLAAFALTTFVLSLANIGFIKPDVVIGLAIFYGGMAQFAAGMWAYKAENNFGGTAFSSYGAFWMAFAIMEILKAANIIDPTGKQVGVMLIAWGIFTFYMWIPSMKIGKVLSLVFLTLWLTFFALGIAAIEGVSSVIGGWIGLICALLAWYVSAGELIEEIYQKKILS
ncbi:MAG: acetate uptake transporter [Thermoplasmata archaeon]|nr:acetate uptake transporter [Thermoplasmata archaeon]